MRGSPSKFLRKGLDPDIAARMMQLRKGNERKTEIVKIEGEDTSPPSFLSSSTRRFPIDSVRQPREAYTNTVMQKYE